MIKNNITEKEFWDNFWNSLSLPCEVDESFSNDHNISTFLKKYVPPGGEHKIALEIGCAPGKWMIFLSKELQYKPEGCEYLDSAIEKTKQNFTLCNIKDAVVHQGDFISFDFENKSYDLIIALGMIEHFQDPLSLIRKMVSLLKTGGILVIGIPKLTGLNYYLCKVLDKYLKYPLLPAHNLSIMNLKFFNDLDGQCNLKKIQCQYIGGFEPDLFDISESPLWIKIVFHTTRILLTTNLFQKMNAGFYSGYIMAAYQKID